MSLATPALRTVDFGGLSIAFDHRVLEPREWTLGQSVWAEDLLPHLPDGPVLELCSGAGHIGLRAVESSSRRLVCVDAEPVAVSFTGANALAAGMASRVEIRQGRLQEVMLPHEKFPMIIADPPWVPRDETGQFPEDPSLAIDGGGDGLDVVRACLSVIEAHLAPGGVALLQLGTPDQADAVSALVTNVVPVEVRYFERGVVLRLDRRA